MSPQRLSAAMLLMLLATETQAAPNKYLCTTEHAAGLRYNWDANNWHTQEFSSGTKYVLRKVTDEERSKDTSLATKPSQKTLNLPDVHILGVWLFNKIGNEKFPNLMKCTEWTIPYKDTSLRPYFDCESPWGSGNFDVNSLRFEYTVDGGYTGQGIAEYFRRTSPDQYKTNQLNGVEINPDHPDDIAVSIGSCSPTE